MPNSEIPDVLPSPDSEATGPQARPVATVSAPAKTTPPKPKESAPVTKPKPAAVVTAPAAPARAAGQRTHVVTKGDTVYSLARKYGFTAEEIAKANGLNSGYNIKLGQPLRIPVKR